MSEYISQRATDSGQLAGALGVSKEVVEEDIRVVRGEWRRSRRGTIEEVGDATLRSLDADEVSLRAMLREAKTQKSLSIALKIMDMIGEKQKLRLQLCGLLTAEGTQAFKSGISDTLDGEGGENGAYMLYSSEVEGTDVDSSVDGSKKSTGGKEE